MYANSRWTARFLPTLLLLTSLTIARGLLTITGSPEALVRLFPLRCPFRATTGIPCPTCGLGHALVDAWIGQWESSLSHHPLGLVTLATCIGLSLWYLVRPESVKKRLRRLGLALSERPRLIIGAVLIYLLVGVIRAFFHLL